MSIKPILVCEVPISSEAETVLRIREGLNALVKNDYYVIVCPSDKVTHPIFKTNHPDLYSLEELEEITK